MSQPARPSDLLARITARAAREAGELPSGPVILPHPAAAEAPPPIEDPEIRAKVDGLQALLARVRRHFGGED